MKHFSLILLFFTFFFAVSVEAQKSTRRGNSRVRKPRPASVAPSQQPTNVLQPEIVSTADQDLDAGETIDERGQIVLDPRGTNARTALPTSNNRPTNSRNRNQLSDQVKELTDKINSLEKQQRNLLNLERLSRAEERAESLRRQLSDATEREGNLSARIEELTYAMRPEVIQLNTAVIGSTRPEEVRDARHKAIENDLNRTKEQLAQVKANKVRLETAVANADMLVEKLRARVEEELDPADRVEETKAKDSETKTDETTPSDDSSQPPIDN